MASLSNSLSLGTGGNTIQPYGSPSFQNVKDLKFVITLGHPSNPFGVVGGQRYNTITLQGLRASVYIDNAGGGMMGTLRAQVFGITADDLNRLTSTIWDNLVSTGPGGSGFAFNSLQVFAIDGQQETLVYNGDVLNSWGVFTSMPEVYLYMEAQIGYKALVQPTGPLSISASTDVATVMQQIATAMGYQFENNGVNISVSRGTYQANTLMEQARALMQAYRFWMYMDSTQPNTLAIAPYGKARNTVAALVSPQTGLIGYPMFNNTGINFETLFNPAIVFGGPVQVESSIDKAKGSWVVVSMSYQLTSQTPGGPWKATVNAVSPTTGAYFG